MDEDFRNAENEFYRLRGLATAGRMSLEEFAAAVDRLRVQDAQGRWWTIARGTGHWLLYNGDAWVEANPPGGTPPPPMAQPTLPPIQAAQPAKSGGWGCGRFLACGCLSLLLLVVLAAGGGSLAYTQGWLTPKRLLSLAGYGPAYIEVDNLRQDTIYATLSQMSDQGTPTPASTIKLSAFDVEVLPVDNPGRYVVTFGTTDAGSELGTCSLNVRGGDRYQFTPLPDTIAVNRNGETPPSGTDLVVATSTLCK